MHRTSRAFRDVVLDRRPLGGAAVVTLTGVAGALWAASLPAIDLGAMTDMGLVSVLPPGFFAGILVLTLAFVTSLRMRPLVMPLVAITVVSLIGMLYGVTVLIEDAPRVSITWLHAGFAELIQRTGELSNADARFDWPLFFVVSAFVTEVAGLDHPVQLAHGISLILNLAYVGPLAVIFRSATSDWRLIWFAVWIFLLANWVGQDYFSPQGFNFLLFLTVIAILLRWFRPPASFGGWLDRVAERAWLLLAPVRRPPVLEDDVEEPPIHRRQRVALVALVILLFAAIAASHQLTPFALLGAVTALVLFTRCSLRGLPLLMAVMIATWISYMTVAYLSGHLPGLLASVGQADTVTQENVAERVTGSRGHLVVVYARLALSALIWLLAAVGMVRRVRAGRWDLSLVLLATAPFVLIWLHAYGGELLLRIYLFSLPFMAFFVAATLYPTPERASVGRSAAAIALTGVLAVGFLVARYGNERADMFTADEVATVAALYDRIEPGSLLLTANYNSVVGYRDFDQHRQGRVRNSVLSGDIAGLRRAMQQTDADSKAYLVLTRSQQATAEMFSGLTPGSWERLLQRLRRTPDFREVLSSSDAAVFTLAEEAL